MLERGLFFIAGRTRDLRRYEHHLSAFALVLGFIWDLLTLGRPDSIFANIVFLGYLMVAGIGIVLLNLKLGRGKEAPFYLLPLIQFSFGNLAGGLLIVYGQSGTVAGSALFFLLLLGFFVGNEFLRNRYTRTHFHLAVWYLLLLLYMSLVVPIILGEISERVFLMSGVGSLIVTFGFFAIISVLNADALRGFFKIGVSVGAIFLIFSGLYFLNIIPPVPLSLTDIGIYHSISRVENGYRGAYEKPLWSEFFHSTSGTYTTSGVSAYCFSSVYAPVGLSTPIAHRFEHYDEASRVWVTKSRIFFPISGGRDEGYRGFSQTASLEPGKWRCNVETDRGVLIGRASFSVRSGTPVTLSRSL